MNEKITLPGLVQLLALRTGDTKKETEDFIKEFFATTASLLEQGDNVKVKSLGTFKTVMVGARKSVNVSTGEESNIPAHRKAVFVPSKEISDRINEPFSMFETIEIDEDVNFDDTEDILEPESVAEPLSTLQQSEDTLPVVKEPVRTEIVEIDPQETHREEPAVKQKEEPETKLPEEPETERSEEPEVRNQEEPETEVGELEEGTEEEEEAKSRFGVGFLSGFISAVVVCGLCFVGWYYIDWQSFSLKSLTSQNAGNVQPVNTDTLDIPVETSVVQPDDSVMEPVKENTDVLPSDEGDADKSVETLPSDQKVYDVIGKTRYLTTMAKDHYGNYNLWPYIYMENQAFLGHPDRIKPGTKVVIPPLSKYGVDPKNPKDIAEAKKKGIEIYSRYK